MSAPLSHEQLSMFMPAKQLRGMHLSDAHVWLLNHGLSSASPDNVRRSRKNVMQRKRREAKKSGLYDSIKSEGVREPVDINSSFRGKGELVNGHHRVAAAMAIDPNMIIPVRH